ncbi:MAG: ATP-binding protein [Clostridia bacterium]|nr:ATP-binding protein [Clostridia bacterium]
MTHKCHKANAELIALVIDNYLSNAVKNTEAGNIIEVRLNTLGLTVFNEGKPIDEKEGRNLWDVFYKEDKARTKNGDNSTGMGLAICKQILMLHKFQYGYKNMPGGVEFFFWIM